MLRFKHYFLFWRIYYPRPSGQYKSVSLLVGRSVGPQFLTNSQTAYTTTTSTTTPTSSTTTTTTTTTITYYYYYYYYYYLYYYY